MRVLHVCNKFDPAADVVRCVNELQRYSKHEHRMIVREAHPLQSILQYETPELCTDPAEAFAWADVVIFEFVGWNTGWNILTTKPMAFRNINIRYDAIKGFWAEDQYNADDLGAYKLLASSHAGAGAFLPGCRLLPDLIPINRYLPDFTVRPPCISYIKHAHTLDQRLVPCPSTYRLRLDMTAHAKVLDRRQRQATCVIDNVCDGHYGLAGLEAMSMGLPTVVYNHAVTRAALKDLAPEYPPFAECGPDLHRAANTATDVADNMELRRSSRDWMERFYHSRRLIEKYWDPFVEELLG